MQFESALRNVPIPLHPSQTDVKGCETPPRIASPKRASITGSHSLSQSLANRTSHPYAPFIGAGRPSLKEGLGFEVWDFDASAKGAQFSNEFTQLYEHVLGDNGRGIRSMVLKEAVGDPLTFVYRMGACKGAALLTGFKVPVANGPGANPANPQDYHGIQETDGPLGVAFMAYGFVQTRKPVSVICDTETEPLVKACLKEIGGQRAVDAVRFLPYDALDSEEAQTASTRIAAALAETGTDLLIPIETAGRNCEGVARSMAGIDISAYNPDYDTLINTLSRQMHVAAIGDGGNEAGFGGTIAEETVPKAKNGKEMRAVTGAGYSMRARVSNWGALAAYAAYGRLNLVPKDQMPTVQQHNAAIRAMLAAGAVDGCSKKTDERFFDGTYHTGVDGMTVEENGELYRKCVSAFSDDPIEFPIGRFPEWKEPLTVMLLDSSAGVFIAADKMMPYLETQLGRKDIRYVLFADFGNAPYGPQKLEAIEQHVADAVGILGEISDAPVVMACNTAGTGIIGLENKGVRVSAINLVVNSSNVIAAAPHQRVALLSTKAMADSGLFQRLITHKLESKGLQKDVGVFGCPEWAEIVNEKALTSPDEATRSRAMEAIWAALRQLPPDLDAIYLCCTHFPALTDVIRNCYVQIRSEAGINRPFAIIDPITKQAETAVRVLSKGGFNERPIRSEFPIVVLTTGDVAEARDSARTLLKRDDIDVRPAATIAARAIERQINELYAAAKAFAADDDGGRLAQLSAELLGRIARQPEQLKLSSLDFLVHRLAVFLDPEAGNAPRRELVLSIMTDQVKPAINGLRMPDDAPRRYQSWQAELLSEIDSFAAEEPAGEEAELAG